jgi:hypothetical protein
MCRETELCVSSIRLPAFGANTWRNGTFQQAHATCHSFMDQSPRVEPLTILPSVGDGLAQAILMSKGTISDRKPCVLYVQIMKTTVPMVAFALLLS